MSTTNNSEIIHNYNRGILKDREKSANWPNRKSYEGSSRLNGRKIIEKNIPRQRNIRTARPLSIRNQQRKNEKQSPNNLMGDESDHPEFIKL